jgi:hypothetical protein
LSKTVDFKFPTGVTIPANGYALLVNFDPANATQRAAFVAKYAVPTNTPLFGPYGGKLDNSSGSIKLSRPDTQGTNGNVPYIEVDQVDYTDSAPWPTRADGIGLSLNRITTRPTAMIRPIGRRTTHAGSWLRARAAADDHATAARLHRVEGTEHELSVGVSGTGPFFYHGVQW